MNLCLMVGALALQLASPDFTLSWTHSVEKTGWREDWRLEERGLSLTRAAVKGSGAGMEPGPGAALEGDWWVWEIEGLQVPELRLAASGATGGGWQLCADGTCHELGATPGEPVVVAPCGRGS
jgi:hypothetical protein